MNLLSVHQVINRTDKVAVVGDGKLGLLVAQALVVQGHASIRHFGKHSHKLGLVQGTERELVDNDTATKHAQVWLHPLLACSVSAADLIMSVHGTLLPKCCFDVSLGPCSRHYRR